MYTMSSSTSQHPVSLTRNIRQKIPIQPATFDKHEFFQPVRDKCGQYNP